MARLLSIGTSGSDVRELQAALNFHLRRPATALEPDGALVTEARVRDFQRRAKLHVDGLVGKHDPRAVSHGRGGRRSDADPARCGPTRGGASRGPAIGIASAPRQPFAGTPRFGQVLESRSSPTSFPRASVRRRPEWSRARASITNRSCSSARSRRRGRGSSPSDAAFASTLPWPIFLPAPVKLEVESTTPGVGRFQLDAKLKVPFTLIQSRRLELKPWFFTGAGVTPHHFEGLNAGAGGTVKLRLLENIGGSGVSVGVEADGGVKFEWNRATGQTKTKGIFEGSVTVELLRF